MIVGDVEAGSSPRPRDLRVGDRVAHANGQAIEGRMDWQRVRVNLDPATPLELRVERDGRNLTVRLPLTADPYVSLPGLRPGLIAFRLAQVITLGLAILVAVRRRSQPSALLGALLLASIATLSLVLPMRMAVFWRSLPPALGLLLWLPVAVSCAVGPLLFAFFATFPRRTWSHRRLGLAMVPAVVVVGWSVYATYEITRAPGVADGRARLDGLGVRRQRRVRDWRRRPPGVASTGGRVAHRPAPHQRARGGRDDRRRRRRGRGGGLLAQPGRGLLRDPRAHGAVAGVSRRAGVVCLRHPAPASVRPPPHRPAGRALRAGAAAVCRADSGARRAAAGRRAAAPQRAAALRPAVALVVVHAGRRGADCRATRAANGG